MPLDALHWPEPPLLASGALGGPACIFLVTPLRNGMTLAAQDPLAGVRELYGRAFARGRGWAGGHYMAAANVPGFLVVGPAYHVYDSLVGPLAATALTAATGNVLSYGAEVRNAQIAFNRSTAGRPLQISTMSFFGPGWGHRLARNTISMSGLRILGPRCEEALGRWLPDLAPGLRSSLGMVLANVCTGALSMPSHQLFQFAVTQQLAQGSRPVSALDYLRQHYFTPSGWPRATAGRDVLLKIVYNASLFTLFSACERGFLMHWPAESAHR